MSCFHSVPDELEAVGPGVPLHEAHEAVPLLRRAHHVLGLDPRRLAVHELGAHVHGLQHALVVHHVKARDVAQLRRRVEHRRTLEREDGHAVGAVAGLGQPHVRDRLLVRALDELDRRPARHRHHLRPPPSPRALNRRYAVEQRLQVQAQVLLLMLLARDT
nr:unknown [Zea mays]